MANDLLGNVEAKKLISLLENLLWHEFSFKVEIGIELEFYLPNLTNFETFESLYDYKVIKERGSFQYEVNLAHSSDLEKVYSEFYYHKYRLTSAAAHLKQMIDFSPKPFKNDYGSSAHYHLSLVDENGNNVFAYSEVIMKAVIAAILEMTNSMLYLLINGDADNFARFTPNFMAPINISWGGNNRTTLVRIPDAALINKRIEFRLPAVTTPPEYIIIFLLLSVLQGLEKKREPIGKIYGNAHDAQYALTKIITDLVTAKKCFRFGEIIANYKA